MHELTTIILLTLFAGIAMPIGAVLASIEKIRPAWLDNELRHSLIAFGGGALLSAVALVLVPEGIEALNMPSAMICFFAGGLVFMWLDILLYKINTPATQLAAMLSDFIPESLALGAIFTIDGASSLLLAFLMALQNLPEGFNAFRELVRSPDHGGAKLIIAFSLMALLGPAAGIAGYLWLANYPEIVGGIMLFASGGILYSMFQDIAPQAKLRKHWAPPLGALLGFSLGIAGEMLI